MPTRVVTTVPAKEPRLDQQPIKSALKKVLLIVSYMFDTDYFTKEKVLPIFVLCLKIFAFHRGAKNGGSTPPSSQNNDSE